MPTHPQRIVAFVAFAAGALAQTTHLVGAGGLPQIRDALAIAAPGDVVLVQPGIYAQFTANVGVTIRAAVPGTVVVDLNLAVLPPTCTGTCMANAAATRFLPPPGQAVHCDGLQFVTSPLTVFGVFHRVLVDGGTVTFTNCTMRSIYSHALSVTQARVHLQNCTLECLGTGNGWPPLAAYTSTISAVRCSLTASQTTLSIAGAALWLRGSSLQGSQLQLRGGLMGFGGGAAALDLDATSSAWISDSQLTGGGGACPVVNNGGSGRIDRSVLLPSLASCTSLPTAPVLGIDSTTPPQAGAPFVVDFRTVPNQLIGLYASGTLGNGALPGLADQPLGLDSANAWFAGLVTADANGFASSAWTLPNGPFVGVPLFVLGVGLAPPRVELSPPVGGVVR